MGSKDRTADVVFKAVLLTTLENLDVLDGITDTDSPNCLATPVTMADCGMVYQG
jgi:hypothetical protein